MTISPPHAGPNPDDVYHLRWQQHRQAVEGAQARCDLLGRIRVAAAILAALVLVALVAFESYQWWWLAIPLLALVPLSVAYHRSAKRAAWRRRAATYYERALRRVRDEWSGHGEQGSAYADPAHLYAADLDLFGPGSLFERLCEARTRIGQDTLAAWLRAPADPPTVRNRQEAVAELRDRIAVRESLAVLGDALPGGIDTHAIEAWASQPGRMPGGTARRALDLLTLGLGFALLGWAIDLTGPWPVVAVLSIQAMFVGWLMARSHDVLKVVERRAGQLAEIAGILTLIEREQFTATLNVNLQRDLATGGLAPSQQLARLSRLIDLLNARRNQFFMPFAILFMWGTRMAFALEAWRRQHGAAVAQWFRVIGEVEALSSLAAYAFENPNDPFPEFVDQGPRLVGKDLGHPLLPRARCVRNDVRLDSERRLLVVSGSNMSGKSTYLRTVGVNVVLAQIGAPVRATELVLSPLAIGATLRIQDSLQEGKSRFFAEIKRLQTILEMAHGPRPLLFLLDELLHGTNSHDRGIGGRGVVTALLECGAIGLVTTHDLSLASIAESLAPRAANVHFADQFDHGQMTFDYKMREGVVPHSNALGLMRAIGLPV